MHNLLENSLYSNPTERAALVSNKKDCADSLMFNFFGFLSIYKITDNRATVKTYGQTEGKLWLKNIGDENHDVSLSVKLAYEAGVITADVANEMTKMLVLIKSKTITSANLMDDNVRALLLKIPFRSHCTASIVTVLHHFESGSIPLELVSKELFDICKTSTIFNHITKEFKGYIIKGNYITRFRLLDQGLHASQKGQINPVTSIKSLPANLPTVPIVTTPVTTTSNVVLPTPVAKNAPVAAQATPTVISTPVPVYVPPAPPPLKVVDDEFYRVITDIGLSPNTHSIKARLADFEKGYDLSTFNKFDFDSWVTHNLKSLDYQLCGLKANQIYKNFEDHPFIIYFLTHDKFRLYSNDLDCLLKIWLICSIDLAMDKSQITFILDLRFDRNPRIKILAQDIAVGAWGIKFRNFIINYYTKQVEYTALEKTVNEVVSLIKHYLADFRNTYQFFNFRNTFPFVSDTIVLNRPKLDSTILKIWLACNSGVYKKTNAIGINLDGDSMPTFPIKIIVHNDTQATMSVHYYLRYNYNLSDSDIIINKNSDSIAYTLSTKALESMPINIQDVINLFKGDIFNIVNNSSSDKSVYYVGTVVRDNFNGSRWSITATWKRESDNIYGVYATIANGIKMHGFDAILKEVSRYQSDLCYISNADKMVISEIIKNGTSNELSVVELILKLFMVTVTEDTYFILLLRAFFNKDKFNNIKNDFKTSIDYKIKNSTAFSYRIPNIIGGTVLLEDEQDMLFKYIIDNIEWANSKLQWLFDLAYFDPTIRVNVLCTISSFCDYFKFRSGTPDDILSEKNSKVLECILECTKRSLENDMDNFIDLSAYKAYGWINSLNPILISAALDNGILKNRFLNEVCDIKWIMNFIVSDFSISFDDDKVDTVRFLSKKAPDFLKEICEKGDVKTNNMPVYLSLQPASEINNLVKNKGIDGLVRSVRRKKDGGTLVSTCFSMMTEKMISDSNISADELIDLYTTLSDAILAKPESYGDHRITLSDKDSFYKNAARSIRNLHKTDSVKADTVFKKTKGGIRKKLISDYAGENLLNLVKDTLSNPANLIRPLQDLTPDRIEAVLGFNDIKMPTEAEITAKTPKSKFSLSMIDDYVVNFAKNMQHLKISVDHPDNVSPEYFEKKSVEYDKFNKYRHGDISVKFLNTFKVSILEQHKAYDEWKQNHPSCTEMTPVFHGTGSVAASMIIRYGFTVIPSTDPLATGRMLGDGIYFSNVLDKVTQYIMDKGFTSNKVGNKGYIFEMKVQFQNKGFPSNPNADYDWVDAGEHKSLYTGRSQVMRSNEGCVYQYKSQAVINKAFFVEIISKNDMASLKAKYPQGINAGEKMKITTFTEFLNEAKTVGYNQTITYIFNDAFVPFTDGTHISWTDSDFDKVEKKLLPNVRVEGSAIGLMVIIDIVGDDSVTYCIDNTSKFMYSYKEDLDAFIKLAYG
jgi:hypothetical protein